MPSNGRSIKFYKYYKQWVETYKVGQVRGVTLNKYYLVARQIKKLAPDLSLSKITRTDEMLFHCDSCHKNSLLDTYDVLTAADGLHCPLCGDNAEHLTVANEEINLNFKLEDVKKFGVTFDEASKVFEGFRKGGH